MSTKTPIVRLTMPDEFGLKAEFIRRKEIRAWCEDNLKPVLTQLDPKLRHYLGEDFARSGDLSVLAIGEETQQLELSVRLIVELGNIPFKQQEQIVEYIIDDLPRFSGGAFDARGNGQYLAETMTDKYGSLIDSVMLSEKWYRENTAQFKSALEDGTLINIPQDADILSDLSSFEVVKGVPRVPDKRQQSSDGKSKRHGDSGIALLLMLYISLSDPPTEIGLITERDEDSGIDSTESVVDMFDDYGGGSFGSDSSFGDY